MVINILMLPQYNDILHKLFNGKFPYHDTTIVYELLMQS